MEAAPTAAEKFLSKFSGFTKKNSKYDQLEISLNPTNWSQISGDLKSLLEAIVSGATAKA